MDVPGSRAKRVREVEVLPTRRKFKVKDLEAMITISGNDILCLSLLAENLTKFLPSGLDLAALVEKLQFALIDHQAVTASFEAMRSQQVEKVIKEASENSMDKECLAGLLMLLKRVTEPLKKPCQLTNHKSPFGPLDKVLEYGQPLVEWQQQQDLSKKRPQTCPPPSAVLPLLELMSIKPGIDMMTASESMKAQYPIFMKGWEKFLSTWPAINRYLDPFYVIVEGPDAQDILNAFNRLPQLPGGVQPDLIDDPLGFQSSAILGGFATRADADATAIALRMVFRLPAQAAAGGAIGGPIGGNAARATIWVVSTAAGMAVF